MNPYPLNSYLISSPTNFGDNEAKDIIPKKEEKKEIKQEKKKEAALIF